MSEETTQKLNNLGVRTGMLIGKATIYGTNWCRYTTDQKKAFQAAEVPFDYVNCEKTPDMCQGIKGYPVVKGYPNAGDSWEGFKALPKG